MDLPDQLLLQDVKNSNSMDKNEQFKNVRSLMIKVGTHLSQLSKLSLLSGITNISC